MPDKQKRYYWDSNVFITLISNLDKPDAIKARENCKLFFQEAIDGKSLLYTSTASMVEVIRAEENDKIAIPYEIKDKLRELFEEPYIIPIPLDAARASEARELRWGHPWLRTLDAIQVACAIYAKVDVMHTYDGLTKPNGILTLNGLVGSPPLKIVVPQYEGQAPWF